MKFLNNSAKTNWKFLAIVIVFALLVVGGVLLLKTTKQPAPSPTPIVPKSISLTSPQDMEQWEVGSRHSIIWNSVEVETVRISIAIGGKDLGTSQEIDASLDRHEDFVVPDMSGFGIAPPYEVTVKVFDAQDPNVSDRVTFTAIEPFDTADWQTYRNEEFGFEFFHPLGTSVRADATYSQNSIATYIIFKKDGFHQTIFVYKKPSGESLLNWYNTNFSGITVVEGPIARIINGYKGLEVVKGSLEIMKSVFIGKNDMIIEFIFPAKVSGGFITMDQQSVLDSFRFVEPLDTSPWQTYRNEEFGFEVRYPVIYDTEQRYQAGKCSPSTYKGAEESSVFVGPLGIHIGGTFNMPLTEHVERKLQDIEELDKNPDISYKASEPISMTIDEKEAIKIETEFCGASCGVPVFIYTQQGDRIFRFVYDDGQLSSCLLEETQLPSEISSQILSTFRFAPIPE